MPTSTWPIIREEGWISITGYISTLRMLCVGRTPFFAIYHGYVVIVRGKTGRIPCQENFDRGSMDTINALTRVVCTTLREESPRSQIRYETSPISEAGCAVRFDRVSRSERSRPRPPVRVIGQKEKAEDLQLLVAFRRQDMNAHKTDGSGIYVHAREVGRISAL